MCKTSQASIIFLIFIFHFNYILGSQTDSQIHPCDLMFHGRDIYQERFPNASDLPLARLPFEFSLNYSLPKQYHPIVSEVVLHWNAKIGFEFITLSDQIDDSEWNSQQQSRGSKNVIYWLNEDQYNVEDITLRNGTLRSGADTFIRSSLLYLQHLMFLSLVVILLYMKN